VNGNTEQLTGRQRSNANLRPFKPGQSGNPSGRPKGRTVSEWLKHEGNEIDRKTGKPYAQLIAKKTVALAVEGDGSARKDYLEYTEGKPSQTFQISRNELIVTGSLDDLIKLRELALENKGVEGDTPQDDVVDVTPLKIVNGDINSKDE